MVVISVLHREGQKGDPSLKTRTHKIAIGELQLFKFTRPSKSDQEWQRKCKKLVIKNNFLFEVGELRVTQEELCLLA